MTIEEWCEIYKATIKEGLECDDDTAQGVLEAGLDDFDYEEDPKEAAYNELSCWQA